MSFTTTVDVATVESTIYVFVATALAKDASTGMALAGLPGHDTNEKHQRVATRQTTNTRIFLLGIDTADQ
jgi:hypothetical protein